MTTELRLAFAMGGGVSLGTFCGGALCQAVKLAVLRSRDKAGKPFDRIVIDAFSGSSAGAMSLAVMLRGLIHQTPIERDQAIERLAREFGPTGEWTATEPSGWRREAMIRAQVAMARQELAWGWEVTIQGLLGRRQDGTQVDLRNAASILDRSEVQRIADKMIGTPPEDSYAAASDQAAGGLLGKRVLYACSIANLTGIRYDGRKSLTNYQAALIGVGDGAMSTVHRELRVFDLRLDDASGSDWADSSKNPGRWFRARVGDKVDQRVGDLRQDKMWQRIAATAIAAGAFPCAFEPVVLKRSGWEYGRPRGAGDGSVGGEMPPDVEARLDAEGHVLHTYVDGGTFNNEPIREAFRMASFLDGQDSGGADVTRQIIAVDPFVDLNPPDLRLPVHARYGVDGNDRFVKTSLDRLVPGHLGTIFSAIRHESTVVEADKIACAVDQFRERETLRAILGGKLSGLNMKELIAYCRSQLDRGREGAMIPPGPLTIEAQLARVQREEGMTDLGSPDALLKWVNDGGAEPANLDRWARVAMCVALDLAMDLVGKSDEQGLVAIAPFELSDAGGQITGTEIPLPGAPLEGFVGFCSRVHRPLEFRVARYCAQQFMEKCGIIAPGPVPPDNRPDAAGKFVLSVADQLTFDREVKQGLHMLAERVRSMVVESKLVSMGIFTPVVLKAIGDMVAEKVVKMADETPPVDTYELEVTVHKEGLELDGVGDAFETDVPSEPAGAGAWVMRTVASWDRRMGQWSGPNVHQGDWGAMLKVDEDGSWSSDSYALVPLPTDLGLLRLAAQKPNPTLAIDIAASKRKKPDQLKGDWRASPGVGPLDDD